MRMEELKQGAATITAVGAIAAIVGSVVVGMFLGTVTVTEGLAFLGPVLGGATVYLWNKQAAADAAQIALAQPNRLSGESKNSLS